MDTTLSNQASAGADLIRTSLVDRVWAARPAIISLVAPAGFGKSTFVRQLLAGAASSAVCDCRGVGSDVDLARRLVPALADETPERSNSLSQSETMLGDGHGSSADRVGVALAAWRTRTQPSTFVFENTEDAIADPVRATSSPSCSAAGRRPGRSSCARASRCGCTSRASPRRTRS